MGVTFYNGWLAGVKVIPSPNFSQRPDSGDISLIVLHNISLPPGQYGTGAVPQFFQNRLDHAEHAYFETIKDLEVSAHFLIERSGQVVQFVSTYHRAWHAGRSSYQEREDCNDFSIGIELEGDDHGAFEAAQMDKLELLIRALMSEHDAIKTESGLRIAGHSDIAPGRKTDPGPFFSWSELSSRLGQKCIRE